MQTLLSLTASPQTWVATVILVIFLIAGCFPRRARVLLGFGLPVGFIVLFLVFGMVTEDVAPAQKQAASDTGMYLLTIAVFALAGIVLYTYKARKKNRQVQEQPKERKATAKEQVAEDEEWIV